jgi:elongation factor P
MRATQLRPGDVIRVGGELYLVLEAVHVTPGKGVPCMQTKLRNLNTGIATERRFRSTEDVEEVFVDRRKMQYLYSAGDEHWFMDVETYDQISFPTSMVKDVLPYLLPNTEVTVLACDGRPVAVEPPRTVDLKIIETPPPLKGATITAQYKEAVLETGLRVQVPSYLRPGEVVRIDTATGEFVERVGTIAE